MEGRRALVVELGKACALKGLWVVGRVSVHTHTCMYGFDHPALLSPLLTARDLHGVRVAHPLHRGVHAAHEGVHEPGGDGARLAGQAGQGAKGVAQALVVWWWGLLSSRDRDTRQAHPSTHPFIHQSIPPPRPHLGREVVEALQHAVHEVPQKCLGRLRLPPVQARDQQGEVLLSWSGWDDCG